MNIWIVLVTYNRLEKLKHSLECYAGQTYLPRTVLVVDNASTDGTGDFLEAWKAAEGPFEKRVLRLPENTGGAGGFYAGMKGALAAGAEWIWVADDDAYPRADALAKLKAYHDSLTPAEREGTAAICAAVYNGRQPHLGHRNHLKVTKTKVIIKKSRPEEYGQESFEFNLLSYVGSCIRAEAIRKAGLDEKDYFIYCDDQEHSLRLNRTGRITCVPGAVVDHDTPPFDEKVINWGKFYAKRNDLLMVRKNFPKRYFLLRYIRRYYADCSVFSKKDPLLKKIYKAAYRDARANRKGLHPLYRPGWTPEGGAPKGKQKIDIVTPYGTANYGTNLQAAALAEMLKERGYDAGFFGGLKAPGFFLRHPRLIYARAVNKINKKKSKAFFAPVPYPVSEERKERLKEFKEETFKTRKYDGAGWKQAVKERTWFAAGGDILWNPAKGYPARNFLDFAWCAKLPRFSYGSSVGAQELPKQYYPAYRRYLGSMAAVGVREQAVADMLEPIIGRPVTQVADPVLTRTAEDWNAYAEKAAPGVEVSGDGYILCYFVMNDPRYWEYVKKAREATGRQVIVLPMHTLDEEQPYDIVRDGTPYEFIRLVRDAEMILTDSFHACAVSLIYEKEFYLLRRARKAEDAKYDEFLGRYGLTGRIVTDESAFAVKGKTDFTEARKRLEADRKAAGEYLEKALEACKE